MSLFFAPSIIVTPTPLEVSKKTAPWNDRLLVARHFRPQVPRWVERNRGSQPKLLGNVLPHAFHTKYRGEAPGVCVSLFKFGSLNVGMLKPCMRFLLE